MQDTKDTKDTKSDENTLETQIKQWWVENGVVSFNETISHFSDEPASDVRRACSKLKKKGQVNALRQEFLSKQSRQHAALAAVNRAVDRTIQKNAQHKPYSKSSQKSSETSHTSCFADGMNWIEEIDRPLYKVFTNFFAKNEPRFQPRTFACRSPPRLNKSRES